MTGIALERVTVEREDSRGSFTAVRDVSLTISEQRVGIVGANGSGKSTLARLFNGLVAPTSGTVTVDGLDAQRDGAKVRKRVGFVFTDPDAQIVMPTVAEDIAFSLSRSSLTQSEREARVTQALKSFGLLDLAQRSVSELSGGQKQLLALAAVTVSQPSWIVADEPTTLLDARNVRLIENYWRQLDQRLIVVTHQLDSISDFDRVIVMDDGQVVADDTPRSALKLYRSIIEAAQP